MKPLTTTDPETKSADLLAENLDKLKALFPEAFTEGKIDFAVLKQFAFGMIEWHKELSPSGEVQVVYATALLPTTWPKPTLRLFSSSTG